MFVTPVMVDPSADALAPLLVLTTFNSAPFSFLNTGNEPDLAAPVRKIPPPGKFPLIVI